MKRPHREYLSWLSTYSLAFGPAPWTETVRCCSSCCPAGGRHDQLDGQLYLSLVLAGKFGSREEGARPVISDKKENAPLFLNCPENMHNRHDRQVQPTPSLSLSPPTRSIAAEENGKQSSRRGHKWMSFDKRHQSLIFPTVDKCTCDNDLQSRERLSKRH